MKKLSLILVLTLVFFVAKAQKIGYIHRDSVIKSMPEMQEATKQLNSFLQQAKQELKTMQDEYNNKVKDYNASQDTLSDLVKQNKLNDINSLQKRIQDFQVNAQSEYLNKQKTLLKPVEKKFNDAVEVVRKKRGYDVIMNISGDVMYVNPKYIITEQVMKQLGIQK